MDVHMWAYMCALIYSCVCLYQYGEKGKPVLAHAHTHLPSCLNAADLFTFHNMAEFLFITLSYPNYCCRCYISKSPTPRDVIQQIATHLTVITLHFFYSHSKCLRIASHLKLVIATYMNVAVLVYTCNRKYIYRVRYFHLSTPHTYAGVDENNAEILMHNRKQSCKLFRTFLEIVWQMKNAPCDFGHVMLVPQNLNAILVNSKLNLCFAIVVWFFCWKELCIMIYNRVKWEDSESNF